MHVSALNLYHVKQLKSSMIFFFFLLLLKLFVTRIMWRRAFVETGMSGIAIKGDLRDNVCHLGLNK